MAFTKGENVGAYRIVEKLGQGGMATVYKAYHPALDRYVAIKVMHPAFMEDPNFLARFQREARIVAKLDHPNIIPIYDFAEHEGHPYLVMRFIEGETLKAHAGHTPLHLQEILRIARAVGSALTYAHERGVLHRDIKPSNVLLTPEGGVYLTDFGLARMAEAGESTLSRDMMVGTPQYISPEQAKGIKDLDARTDVYSLGVVLYELLVGRAPFTADTPYAIIHDHIFTPLPLPKEINPDLPEPVERTLLKALAKTPDDRFESVAALIEALEQAVQTTAQLAETQQVAHEAAPTATTPAAPSAKPVKRKKRLWLWATASIVVVVCLGLFLCLGLNAVRKNSAGDIETRLDEAQRAMEEGDLAYALEIYQQIVEQDPHAIPAYIEASHALIKSDRPDQAMQVLQRGINQNPDAVELHLLLGEIALLWEDPHVAEAEIEWMRQEMGDQSITYAYDGMLMLQKGQPCEEARPVLEKALEINPDLAWGHYGMAHCFLHEDNAQDAQRELDRVLKQEAVSPLLRAHAEEMMAQMGHMEPKPEEDPPSEEDVEQAIIEEFESLKGLASEIKDDDLRTQFKEQLDAAQKAWEEGNREEAIAILQETSQWLHEHNEALGPLLFRALNLKVNRILNLADM